MQPRFLSHHFNVSIAQNLGVDKAIIINHLAFWIKKNMSSKKHFNDGYYWTYNTSKGFAEIFPYWSPNKIQKMLKSLENDGIIVSGNYNKAPFDRTKWYAIKDDCIRRMYELESSDSPNVTSQNAQPIPDIITDIETDNTMSVSPTKKPSIPYQKILDIYHKCLPNNPKVMKLTDKRKKQIKKIWEDDDSYQQLSTWEQYFQRCAKSTFLTNKVTNEAHPNFKVDFEWLTNFNNFVKVIEGKYDEKTGSTFVGDGVIW